jgi:hypothetical protein
MAIGQRRNLLKLDRIMCAKVKKEECGTLVGSQQFAIKAEVWSWKWKSWKDR